MPPQKGQPKGILSKFGNRLTAAHNKAKDQDTDYGNLGDLPPGINGGVAQLTEIKLDTIKEGKKNAGEPFFYAAGIVVSPKQYDGMQVEGMRTSVMTVLCDTPERNGERKRFEDHYAWMMNELRKLGVDTSSIGPDDLEGVFATLKQQKPFFRFRTWAGQATPQYPNPRTNHDWGGLVDYDSSESDEGAVADGSEVATGGEGTSPEEAAEGGAEDVEALGVAGDADDEAAQERLTELANEVGLTESQIGAAENWSALASLIVRVQSGESIEEEGGGWSVGDACTYAPKDPKDKTGVKRLARVQCKVLKIDGAEVDLQSMADAKKKYLKVSVNEIDPV